MSSFQLIGHRCHLHKEELTISFPKFLDMKNLQAEIYTSAVDFLINP